MGSRIAVIGAGPAGLTAAYRLATSGVEVDLYEGDSKVGGMAKSLDLWGHRVDLGPHRFFSSDKRVNSLWLEVMGRDYSLVDRMTRIYYNQRFFDYPLNAKNVVQNFGPIESARCFGSLLSTRNVSEDGSYESWLVRRFGRRLFDIFFRSYSEKLWGLPCSKIDADFAAQRIRKLSLLEAAKSALKPVGKSQHRTLCDQFAYPHGGTGALYERMADAFQKNGGNLYTETLVKKVRVSNNQVQGIELMSGETKDYDQVISSMPLTLLVKALGTLPEEVTQGVNQLRFRNTILVYLRVAGENLFPDQWIYVQSPDLKVGRMTNFRNWGPELNTGKEDTVLCMEYWCFEEDQEWKQPDEAWARLAIPELRKTGLIGDREVLDVQVQRVPRCYPVYHLGYKEALRPVETHLKTIRGLEVIGRYGAFKYNNQDHSILMGLLAAEKVVQEAPHDLWSINSNYEDYQESSRITESGLELDSASSGN